MSHPVSQEPPPGTSRVLHSGDRFTVTLKTPPGGTAWLRTNALSAAVRRQEVIDAVEQGTPRPGQDWEDVPMKVSGPGEWSCTLTLADTGCFEAKAFWLADGSTVPSWPEGSGGNLRLKVEPAWTASRCSIYKAFVRMFRPDLPPAPDVSALDEAGWSVIPPSGTFRNLAAAVPHILDTLGFRIVLLLPPFPVPTTHARMGRCGSPFAALDFYTVDPACAEHDRRTTPLQQFDELADAIHARGGRLFIDVPINHTGWASQTMQRHPEWFRRTPDGEFHSPGAWGVTWADLVELDYRSREVWQEMAEVFLFWCRRGVDGFRCDAGYMVPVPVWEYITARVRREFPDTVFLLEGLGGPVAVTLDLLTTGGLNWAYSELFQNDDRGAIDWYLPQAIGQTATHGLHIHFAETHDNNRLAARGPVWARLRVALSALTSQSGGWGLTCGAEWLCADKIHVHAVSPLHTGALPNLVSGIAMLNRLVSTHPAFLPAAQLDLITRSDGAGFALRRKPDGGGQSLLILANLSPHAPAVVAWRADDFTVAGACLWTGEPVPVKQAADLCSVLLAPGAIYCLPSSGPAIQPPAATTLDLSGALRITLPRDERRAIVWPAGDSLAVIMPCPGRVELRRSGTVAGAAHTSPLPDGTHAALLPFVRAETLRAELHQEGTLRRLEIPLLQAGDMPGGPRSPFVPPSTLTGEAVRANPDLHLLLTNGTGAMSHIRAAWGTVRSQYDCLLGANPDPAVPVDRRMLLTRCRAWVVRRGFSTELSDAWTAAVRRLSAGHAAWDFRLPCGGGHWVELTLTVHLVHGENRVLLHFARTGGTTDEVSLIVRPDVEDRGFHDKTVLLDASVASMSAATALEPGGFRQPCHHGDLCVHMPGAAFTAQSERLTAGHPVDAHRGLGGSSDLFSPGYFQTILEAGSPAILQASLTPRGAPAERTTPALPPEVEPSLKDALMQFVVRRDTGITVIAGYPWFLDWGRDTLIVLRGLIAAGELTISRSVLRTFAAFEEKGTLPNMIRGSDCSNRNTSDAPLWFCVATADLLAAEGSDAFLDEPAGGRPVREIIRSIAAHYISGTPHGIHMDHASGLIWSPAHFTWMDTNHPAGTPREGYPVEIQALWHGTLSLLARVEPSGEWARLAAQVRHSLATLYTARTAEFFSDCLHASSGTPAASAVADDHLRPNQLMAVTLGAVTGPLLTERIITSSFELLIPGAIRTLADRPVTVPLAVYRDGQLLNHPHAPFQPCYAGDEDTRRKPAYHNGTAWPWPMPALAEAIVLTGGSPARARAVLQAALPSFSSFCLGHLTEIMDGAWPHRPGGCGAQAWSVSEVLRIEKLC